MKIAIIGGGPAGLYAAILLRKQRPRAEITVYERNRRDDTFGFGVVFSDATLDNFESYDPPSYRRITEEFAYWDDIAVHFRGTVQRVLRLFAPHPAVDPARARPRTRRDAIVRDRHRRRGAVRRCRSRGGGRRH